MNTIPDWGEVSAKVGDDVSRRDEILAGMTALERFVYANEPAGNEDEAEFRRQLQEMLDEVNPPIPTECVFPKKADLDWLENAVQRHTGGIEPWWFEFKKNSFREVAKVIVTLWEAGRSQVGKNPLKRRAEGKRTQSR